MLKEVSKACLYLNSDSLFGPRHASVYILYILNTDK